MRKSLMIIASAALVGAVLAPAGPAVAAPTGLADLVRAAGPDDLPAFAGYQATTVDGTASTVITLPEATDCTELEVTGAASFMGHGEAGTFVYNLVAAKCEPGLPAEYVAVIQIPGGGAMYEGTLAAGDKIKITINDDGETTTVRMRNLSGGEPIEVTTGTLPDVYEVGTTSLGGPLVGGLVNLTKNRLDGAKLKAAGPTKITYDDGIRLFKPTRLKKGKNFTVTSS